MQEFLSRIINDRHERRTLIIVSVCVFIVQVLTLRSTVVIGEPYWIAWYLKKGFGFAYIFPWDTYVNVTCYIPPLYAFLLYGIMLLGGGVLIMEIMGLLFFHTANFFLYYFFKRHLSKGLSFAGFLAFSLYVPLWLLSEKIDPDALNILLITATIFVLDRFRTSVTTKQWVYLGLLYGIQLLVRPDILVGIVFFGVWLFLVIAERKQFWKGYALSIGIMLLVVAPWTIRNYIVFDRFILVSANSGFNLYIGNNPAATGEFQQGAFTPEAITMDSARAEYFRTHPSHVDRDSYLFQVAASWAISHPWNVIQLGIKKFFFHWWYRESAGSNIQTPFWMVTLYSVVSLLLVVFGLYGLLQLDKPTKWLLITLFAYSTAIAVVFFVQSRHRAIKVDPYLITLSIVGVYTIVKKQLKTR